MAVRAQTPSPELPARLYEDRASNTQSNSRIVRDFLLRVNSDESRGDPEVVASQLIQESPKSEHII